MRGGELLMNVACVAALMFGGTSLLWAATFGVRGLLNGFSTPLEQPDDSPGDPGIGDPPTSGSTSPPQAVVRCRRRVVLGNQGAPSTTLPPATTTA